MKLNMIMVMSSLMGIGSLFWMLFYLYLMMYKKVYLIEYEFFFMNGSGMTMSILLDWMSTSFMSFVLFISFMILIYSNSYMGEDSNISIFILLVFCFVISMMLLIISPNLVSILLGWDGLGLISYCLVIYYQNIKSYNAGMLTALTNRVGDVLILMGIAWMMNLGSWNYLLYYIYENKLFLVVGWLIMLAAMTKSAQIPFSSWLPAAMAAPTPVSALVHSSTLVTAGVYLLIRFNYIFENETLNQVMLLLSVLTMFMSGLGAIFEYDLKKIIALSTLSQLGLMISSICLGLYEFSFFHLLSHALFKSLLFMCAGYIIHGMNDCQDIRYMGSIMSMSPVLCVYFNVSNLSLCGMPFLAGFYSKDLILEMILMGNMNLLIFILYFMSIYFTVVYTFRLVYFSILGFLKSNSFNSFSDNDLFMLSGMFGMYMWVMVGGVFLSWTMFLDLTGVFLPLNLKMMVLFIFVLGIVSGILLGKLSNYLMLDLNLLSNMMSEMWFLPYLSTYKLNMVVLKIGYFYYKMVDLGWGEQIGGQGLFSLLLNFSLWIEFKFLKMGLIISLFSGMLILLIGLNL
uniref:NADH-ubiquinone oxidoreductase chain 5 n=1 Tax=Dypsocus coleoptratus TaxID=297941 RepID=A0A8K1ZFC3_9NEOP|nr:NADH dehydrogenase subunit 5 [Dypsocus coleoptratus]